MRRWCGTVGSFFVALAVGAHPAARAQADLAPMPEAAMAGMATAALSADGRLLLIAQADPPCLVVLDAQRGVPVHALVPAARDGRIATRIAALRTATLRRSFIVAPADLAELWEISYDPKAEDLYDGLVHDYRFGEGVPRRGYLGLRRTALSEPLADFVLDEEEAEAWALAMPPPAGSGEGQVLNLDVRRRGATMSADRMRARMQALREASKPQAGPDLAQRRTASRSWPCTPPKVPAP